MKPDASHLFDPALIARRRLRGSIALVMAALVVLRFAAEVMPVMRRADLVLLDFWQSLRGTERPSPQVVIVAIDEKSKGQLVEKPLATSLAEARHIASMVSASGVRAMVAHTLRFNRTVQTVQAHVPEIGPLHALYLSQRFEPSPLAWLDRRTESGGGIVLQTGVHSFDLLRFLTGCEVTRVWCRTAQIITRETEDSFAMTCQLSDPSLVAAIAGSRAMGGRVGLLELAGARGHLLADHVHGWVHLVRGTERLTLSVPAPVPTVRETLDAFVRALREGTAFPISIEDGLRAVAIADAAYRSAERGGESAAVAGLSGAP